MPGDDELDLEEEWDAKASTEAAGPTPTVTVKITVETWSKRVHMSVSGPKAAVDDIVARFWRGLHYDV